MLRMLWQGNYSGRDWFSDLFRPDEHVFDAERKIILDDCILVDTYLHAGPAEYYAQFRGKNAWLLHLADETYEGGYQHYSNFRGVFRTFWSGVFNPCRVMQLPLGPVAKMGDVSLPADRRPYLWSFMGVGQSGSRPEMLNALQSLEPHFIHATDSPESRPLMRNEYSRIIGDSVFVPCPMGNVNMDSFRVYEALECGAIPILEKRMTLDYFRRLLGEHSIPTFSNWKQAAAFIAEHQKNPRELLRLQKSCTDGWRIIQEELRVKVQEFLSFTQSSTGNGFLKPWYSIPGWRVAELLRHHSYPAARRRFQTMTNRILSGQKPRKTTGC